MSFEEKYIATLVGCALGDTLGMPVESWKPGQIKKYIGRVTEPMNPVIVKDSQGNIIREDEYGRVRCFGRNLSKGDITDDTILTLALAESLAEKKGFDLEDIARKQLKAYEQACSQNKKSFGKTTSDAMKNLQQGISYVKAAVIGGPGNAPAMKMSPLGLYMHATHKYSEGLIQAEKIGRITHLDPRSITSGVVQAHAVFSVLSGISKNDFLETCIEVCTAYEDPLMPEFKAQEAGRLLPKLSWMAYYPDATDEEAHKVLGASDLVTESYPFTLFMFQKYWDEPVKGLLEIVNFGGDADTTGAMFGALVGARHGMVFPEEWVSVLKDKERLINAGKGIYELGTF